MGATELEFSEVVLQRLPAAVTQHWPADVPPPEADVMEGFVDRLVIRLRAHVYGEKAPKTIEFRAPLDWWQAVRERWLPSWWLARRPVLYRREEVDIWNVYPEFVNRIGGRFLRVPVQRSRRDRRDDD